MDKEKIVDAFDKFVNDEYSDSEEILRKEIKQSVNDHLKTKLELEKDPIVIDTSDDSDE